MSAYGPDVPYAKFVGAKLTASLAILEAIEDGALEDASSLPLSKIAQDTLGVRIKPIDEKIISGASYKLDERLRRDFGLRFEKSDLIAFNERFLIEGSAKRETELNAALEWARDRTSLILPKSLASRIIPQVIEDPKGDYLAEVTTDEETGELKAIFNVHEKFNYTSTLFGSLALHEVEGHVFSTHARQTEISNKGLDPLTGITTYHGPEVVHEETIALAMEQIFLKGSPELNLQALLDFYTYMAKHNGHIIANDPKRGGPEAAAAYTTKHLPFESPQTLQDAAVTRSRSLIHKVYSASYWPAMEAAARLRHARLPRQKAAIAKLLSRPLLYHEVSNATKAR